MIYEKNQFVLSGAGDYLQHYVHAALQRQKQPLYLKRIQLLQQRKVTIQPEQKMQQRRRKALLQKTQFRPAT